MTPERLTRLHWAALCGQLDGWALMLTIAAGIILVAGLVWERYADRWMHSVNPADILIDAIIAVTVMCAVRGFVGFLRDLRGRR